MVGMAGAILTVILILSGCQSVFAAGMVRLECGHDEMCSDISLADATRREIETAGKLEKCDRNTCVPAVTQFDGCPDAPIYWAGAEKLPAQTEFHAALNHAASGDLFHTSSRIVEISGTPASERH